MGSPPRMRGKAGFECSHAGKDGITPAYAGKSPECAIRDKKDRDHPRVCGEKRFLLVFQRRFSGSPPRMRGKEKTAIFPLRNGRITPAYAGKRFLVHLRSGLARDHPRVCGEKCGCGRSDFVAAGSPPRMRGKVQALGCGVLCLGITPAYAGKSFAPLHIVYSFGDHPRVCGEKLFLCGFLRFL